MAYSKDEMETILRFDYLDQKWYVWTNVQAHITKFIKQNWKMTHQRLDDGRIVDATFEAPKKFVTIGNVERKKRSGSFITRSD